MTVVARDLSAGSARMTKPSRAARNSVGRTFAAPAAMAILSAIGLVAALLGDDLWDALSWVTLGIPITVMTYFTLRRR